MKAYTAMAAALRAVHCDLIFALLGDANMLYISEFVERYDGRLVNPAHEASVVAAADGYARITRSTGFASVTHGPGFTNSLTALTEAVRARTPLVLLTGTASSHRGALQSVDVSALATTVGAGSEVIATPGSIGTTLAFAVWRAQLERRPIVVDLPADLLLAEVGPHDPPSAGRLPPPSGCTEDTLDEALGLILSSTRPIIVAGRGAAHPRARNALIELSRSTGAPLMTTLLAKDLFHGHPLNLGVCGTISSTLALDMLQASDCLISFGASLNRFTTADGALTTPKKIIQCCLSGADFGAYITPDLAIAGDAGTVAEQMVRRLHDASHTPIDPWGQAAEKLRNFDASTDIRHIATTGLDPRDVAIALDPLLPVHRTLITDCGHFQFAPWKYLTAESGYFFHTLSFGSVGLAMAFATGAALGRPDALTVACVGDGGFMMSLEAFNTAVRAGVNLLVIAFNNGGYAAEYHKLAVEGLPPGLSEIGWPDLAGVAKALGGQAMTVTSATDLDSVPAFLRLPGPRLLDIHVDVAINLY